MIIFERLAVGEHNTGFHIVAIFGLGLIGRSISTQLNRIADFQTQHFRFSWDDVADRFHESNVIADYILAAVTRSSGRLLESSKLDIVWAAGKSGFGSKPKEADDELAAFCDVLSLTERLRSHISNANMVFHHMSSAGGLFEGQRHVERGSIPTPQRPYGVAKLQQELLLETRCQGVEKLIYRPSSVYGFAGNGVRLGLINALLQNMTRSNVSNIYGDADTIRDYILASDIGRFVAQRLTQQSRGSDIFLLASGRPSSMLEIIKKVELASGRKLYLHFNAISSNSSHMSFGPNALPCGWHPTDLTTGIRETARQLVQAFVRHTADSSA
jgi:UDP-glucose 4-epimerase